MKLERATKEYGSGSGRSVFESDLFRVLFWSHGRAGTKTTIACELIPYSEIGFDGAHDFNSDDLCMEQFTCAEILEMISYQKKKSFKDGEESKVSQIKACFDI